MTPIWTTILFVGECHSYIYFPANLFTIEVEVVKAMTSITTYSVGFNHDGIPLSGSLRKPGWELRV
jgi:hypothetical protein